MRKATPIITLQHKLLFNMIQENGSKLYKLHYLSNIFQIYSPKLITPMPEMLAARSLGSYSSLGKPKNLVQPYTLSMT